MLNHRNNLGYLPTFTCNRYLNLNYMYVHVFDVEACHSRLTYIRTKRIK